MVGQRVLRGVVHDAGSRYMRATYRNFWPRTRASLTAGLRLARDA